MPHAMIRSIPSITEYYGQVSLNRAPEPSTPGVNKDSRADGEKKTPVCLNQQEIVSFFSHTGSRIKLWKL